MEKKLINAITSECYLSPNGVEYMTQTTRKFASGSREHHFTGIKRLRPVSGIISFATMSMLLSLIHYTLYT